MNGQPLEHKRLFSFLSLSLARARVHIPSAATRQQRLGPSSPPTAFPLFIDERFPSGSVHSSIFLYTWRGVSISPTNSNGVRRVGSCVCRILRRAHAFRDAFHGGRDGWWSGRSAKQIWDVVSQSDEAWCWETGGRRLSAIVRDHAAKAARRSLRRTGRTHKGSTARQR